MLKSGCPPPRPPPTPAPYTSVLFSDSASLGLLQECEEGVISSEGKGEGAAAVVLGVLLQVLDHLGQQVGPLHACTRGLEAQGSEVHVQVVVGGQVVQVHAKAVSRHLVALQDGFLARKGRVGEAHPAAHTPAPEPPPAHGPDQPLHPLLASDPCLPFLGVSKCR